MVKNSNHLISYIIGLSVTKVTLKSTANEFCLSVVLYWPLPLRHVTSRKGAATHENREHENRSTTFFTHMLYTYNFESPQECFPFIVPRRNTASLCPTWCFRATGSAFSLPRRF